MPDIKLLECSHNTLKIILYGDERLEDIRPVSLALGDTAKVFVRPFEIGHAIKNFDSQEDHFHVELITTPTRSWAEIWLTTEWRESNARRNRVQIRSAEDRVTRDKNSIRVKTIATKLRASGLGAALGYPEHLAATILENYRKADYSATLKLLDLIPILETFEEEDKQDNQNKTT